MIVGRRCLYASLFFFLPLVTLKKKQTEGNKTWSQLDILAALTLQVHPIVWPCLGLICACIKHENKAQYIDQKKKKNEIHAVVVHFSLLAWTLVSSLRTTTCPFNIFLCNGNCSSTIISLHSLILGWLHACASHWLLCTVWSKLDVLSPHSHRETTSKAVAMGRIRKNHFGILTFSLLVTSVWAQG